MTSATRPIRFTLNGKTVDALIGPSETILDVLQRCFNLYGARESCGQGLCGCCTVLVDGTAVSGCLYLAGFADGADVRTVEGLADGERLAPVQEAFIASSAFQCGFCTPGFVLMTTQLLEENPHPDDDDIKHYLSGNLCRCGAYPEILDAVRSLAAAGPAPRSTPTP
jgi:aerobic-type carbon monoxide dehydrogenase small subunit (CoxS/CutS family)